MRPALRAIRIGRVLLRYRLDDLAHGTPASRDGFSLVGETGRDGNAGRGDNHERGAREWVMGSDHHTPLHTSPADEDIDARHQQQQQQQQQD